MEQYKISISDNEVEATNYDDINMSEDGKSDVLDSVYNDFSEAIKFPKS